MNNRHYTLQNSTGIGQPATIWQPDPRKPSYTFTDGTGIRRTGQIRDIISNYIIMEFTIGGFVCTHTVRSMDALTQVQS